MQSWIDDHLVPGPRPERRHAFPVIQAPAQLAQERAFQFQTGLQSLRRRRLDRLLGPREAQRRSFGQARCQLARARGQLFVRHALPDQAPGLRLRRLERLAEQRQAHGARRSDQSRQSPRAPRARQQTEAPKRLYEACRKRGDHHVAGERDIRPRAGGNPVHRGYHRNRQIANREHDRPVAVLDHRAQVDRAQRRVDRLVVQILTAAEGTAGAGQQQAAHRGVQPYHGQRVIQLGQHRACQAVQPVRAVQRQRGNALRDLQLEGFERLGHGMGSDSASYYRDFVALRHRARWPACAR